MNEKILKIAEGLQGMPDTPETACILFSTIRRHWPNTPQCSLMALLALDDILHFGPLVFSRGVRWAYTRCAQECPKSAVIGAISRADKSFLMTKAERDKLASMPDKVTIFHRRGADDPRKKGWGLSWTIGQESMECIALNDLLHKRPKSQYFTASVPKGMILCYFLNRHNEVLVDVPEGWPVNEYRPGIPDGDTFAQFFSLCCQKAVTQELLGDCSAPARLDD